VLKPLRLFSQLLLELVDHLNCPVGSPVPKNERPTEGSRAPATSN